MPRVKLELPPIFHFSAVIPVRITDLNYGGHAGNDTILTFIHEARIQFLKSKGYSELDLGGAGLIMNDVMIEFKNEVFYGDVITASVAAGEFTKYGFDLFYNLETTREGKTLLVAKAKTGMVCFDYQNRKIVSVPDEARVKLETA